jgi:hypothetical protein
MTNTLDQVRRSIEQRVGKVSKLKQERKHWAQIEQAQRQGLYLQAITLEENIIFEYTIGYFKNILKSDRQFDNLQQIADFWKTQSPAPIASGNYQDLIADLELWQLSISTALLAMTDDNSDRSSLASAQPDCVGLESFFDTMRDLSETGEQLALEISQWCIAKSQKNNLYFATMQYFSPN